MLRLRAGCRLRPNDSAEADYSDIPLCLFFGPVVHAARALAAHAASGAAWKPVLAIALVRPAGPPRGIQRGALKGGAAAVRAGRLDRLPLRGLRYKAPPLPALRGSARLAALRAGLAQIEKRKAVEFRHFEGGAPPEGSDREPHEARAGRGAGAKGRKGFRSRASVFDFDFRRHLPI
eukprot:tig00000448_g896.t1